MVPKGPKWSKTEKKRIKNIFLKEKMFSDADLMSNHIDNILLEIVNNSVVNLVSSAGTGKTTSLPLNIAKTNNRIMVVVSNSEIAESLANFLNQTNEKVKYIGSEQMKQMFYDMVLNPSKKSIDTDILMIDKADLNTYNQSMIELLWLYCVKKQTIGKMFLHLARLLKL